MASENLSLVPTQRLDSGLNAAQLLLQDDPSNPEALRFSCSGAAPQHRATGGDPGGPKTRELSGFMDEKLLTSVNREQYLASQGAAAVATAGEFPRSVFAGEVPERRGAMVIRNWNGNGATSTDSEGDESDGEEDEDDDDDTEEVDEGDKILSCHSKDHPFGQPGTSLNRASTSENHQQRRIGHFLGEVTVAEPNGDMCYSQFMQGSDGQKDVAVDNGCGFSGRKDSSTSSNPGDTLRAIFSDPITGSLMDDAMILPCGHSFGGGGIQQVIRMKACYTCSQPVTQDLVSPNLSLRAAAQAFRREEEQMYRASKRRRERFDQMKPNCSDSAFMDAQRMRGVQFPFAVSDRVIIKGNKRTPERFIGREAVVTKQCLNGWYVVKTDNAESVKLQYRSLAKAPDNSTMKSFSDRVRPNWL